MTKTHGMQSKLNSIVILLVLIAVILLTSQCRNSFEGNYTIAFYNVENLFDTINDAGVNDGEYTPTAKIGWDNAKYTKKLKDIAKVLSSINGENLPVIIGLAEVENLGVLKDLVDKTVLKEGNYKIVHFDSPDERGIDVALLYRQKYFTPIYAKPYRLLFSFDADDRTRDMVYVKGITLLGDTLHILADHWPSRSGGQEKSEPKRRAAATLVKQVVDSIFDTNPNANIVVMGDLNDNPTDVSVREILQAQKVIENPNTNRLYNLALNKFENGEGTLYWRSWDLFDQMIVSGNLLQGKLALKLNPKGIQIFKPEWILFERKDGVKVPNRTAGRDDYYGGYSDHLPVYITFSE